MKKTKPKDIMAAKKIIILSWYSLGVALCTWPLHGRLNPSDTVELHHSFKELQQASFKIPTYKDLFSEKKIDEYGQLTDIQLYKETRLLSLERFESTLDTFFIVMDNLLNDPSVWLNKDLPEPYSKSVENNSFVPYAQKLIKAAGSSALIKGDLHGDIHSLIAAIEYLQKLGITSVENPLKISDPSFNLIFLGDYVDRGLWGTEVLFLLMLLKCINPTQVVLMRGNHEDPQVASRYGFQSEFFTKFSDSSLEDRERCYQKICALYEYLPVVLYLGSGNSTHKNFVQCCHGGLEIGYNPQGFLRNSDEAHFHAIRSLHQETESKKLPPFLVRGSRCLPLESYCSDFTPTSPFELGFLWNDFVVDPQEMSRYKKGRGFAFNKEVTEAVLTTASHDDTSLVGVIRAHQHTPSQSDPLMSLLLSSQGCASLWHTQKKHLSFTQGTVLTLLLSPDSLHGQPRKTPDGESLYDGFTYDTSLLLTTGIHLHEWHATVLNNAVYATRQECMLKSASASQTGKGWMNWLTDWWTSLWHTESSTPQSSK